MSSEPLKNSLPADPGARRRDVLEKGLRLFAGQLPASQLPDQAALNAARNAAEQYFREALLQSDILDFQDDTLSAEQLAMRLSAARLDFSQWMHQHPLPLPEPHYTEQLSGAKLAITAMIGTIAGGMGISGLLKLMLPAQETVAATPYGYVLGSVIGAAAAIFLVWQSSNSSKLRNWIKGILGLATAGEIFLLISQTAGLGLIWTTLRGAIGRGFFRFIKRIIFYTAIVLLLKLSVKLPRFQRQSYLDTIRHILDLWMQQALLFLKQRLRTPQRAVPEELPALQQQLTELGSGLHKLHQSPPDMLGDAAAEILTKASSLGFEGLEKQPLFISGQAEVLEQFIWQDAMADKYQAIGLVEDGDRVFVESKPVIHNGTVMARGTVRKVRRKR